MDVSVTGLFFPVLLLNQQWSPPLTPQASHCSTFRIMCDVPSTAVFCSESIECFPGTVPKFFFKPFVTIPLAPICWRYNHTFHVPHSFVSLRRYPRISSSFLLPLACGISVCLYCHIYQHDFPRFVSNYSVHYTYYYLFCLCFLCPVYCPLLPVCWQCCFSLQVGNYEPITGSQMLEDLRSAGVAATWRHKGHAP